MAFYLLTFVVSWTFFIAAALISPGGPATPLGMRGLAGPVFLLGVFAPALTAIALTAHSGGRAAVRALLNPVVTAPAGVRWYVFAAGYMVAIKLAGAILHRILMGDWPAFGDTPLFVMAAALFVSTPVQAGEEIGWRGYALPRLAARIGLGPAAIVLGVIWACWHLPIFFMPGSDTFGQSFTVYLVDVTALSVAMAWLYWRTNRSLLLTMLMHAAINNTKDIVPSAVSDATPALAFGASAMAWLTALVLWGSAAYFLVRMRGAVQPHPGLSRYAVR